jgi:hypothetical protein
VSLLKDLAALCDDAGMYAADAATSIAAYLRRGELSRADIAAYAALSPAERASRLDMNYGSDASRVAALVVARG